MDKTVFIGIEDGTRKINQDFKYEENKIWQLVAQIRSRTTPPVILIPHRLNVSNCQLLVLEIPFSNQIHRTSKGEYLIRSNDCNRQIEPHELCTIQSEKGLMLFDQFVWREADTTAGDNGVPKWLDVSRVEDYKRRISAIAPDNPRLKLDWLELCDAMSWIKEENGKIYPTTTGLLFCATEKALRLLPFSQVSYIRYFDDGRYAPHEYSGNIIQVADECFRQLKSEAVKQEFHFDLLREYVDDYPEVVIRELLINALVHRDYSRRQTVEIRKYPTYLEIESPGKLPQGITCQNFLRRTNARNPNIMDSLREIGMTEKAGSGIDKIFSALLSSGRKLPEIEETQDTVIFRVNSGVCSEKTFWLAREYRRQNGMDLSMDYLIVLQCIVDKSSLSFSELENQQFVSRGQLRKILSDLCDAEIIETSGRTSGLRYSIHAKRLTTSKEKVRYSRASKQDVAYQKEAILRYLEKFPTITNAVARQLLELTDAERSYVSRLFSTMVKDNLILKLNKKGDKNGTYARKK